MSADSATPVTHGPEKGLPPVSPPSGKFIAQLFLTPLVLAGFIIAVVGGFLWYMSSGWTPEKFLEKLDSPNWDVRNRAAADLAKVLPNNTDLASNPSFALGIAERLQRVRDSREADKKKLGKEKVQASSNRKPSPQQNEPEQEESYLLFLTACSGNFLVPAAVEPLNEIALDRAGDARVVAPRRFQAILALGKLGENMRRFDKLPAEKQQAMLEELDAESAAPGNRGKWAGQAHDCLKDRLAGKYRTMNVDKTFRECAEDPNGHIRSITALALGFWQVASDVKPDPFEETLATLVHDARGDDDNSVDPFFPREQEVRAYSSVPGARVRYNANIALARRGSDQARIDLLKEMLDEDRQKEIQLIKLKNDRKRSDLGTIQTTLLTTLQAVSEMYAVLHRKDPAQAAKVCDPLKESIAKLKHSSYSAVRVQAEKTLRDLDK